jgi:hypothetical protein
MKLLGTLFCLSLLIGLMPGMAMVVKAEGSHAIHNTISNMISLSVTKDGSAVTEAESGDTILLTVNGTPTTAGVFQRFNRNIMVDGLAVSKADGGTIELSPAGRFAWTFTMPDADVYVSFPILTANENIPVGTGQAVFRSGKSNGGNYSFTANMTAGSSYEDTVGYLAYISQGSVYTYVADDDSGSNSNSDYNFKIPASSAQVTIANGTYFHLGFALYSNQYSGTFTPDSNVGDVTVSFMAVEKLAQEISASDMSIPINIGSSTVEASITTGDGELSYYVEDGANVIDIDRDTGVITVKEAGTASVVVEASETGEYRRTTRRIRVTVTKPLSSVTTAPTGQVLNENGSEQALVTAGVAEGGTMKYALGENDTEPPYGEEFYESIPTAADAGTYYVWYKSAGDNEHTDTAPGCVTSVIRGAISYTVTFKVVNGMWDDGTTADKEAIVTGYEGDTLSLSETQIPAVGNKPAEGYIAGSWEENSGTGAEISDDVIYTYTYVVDPGDVKIPEDKESGNFAAGGLSSSSSEVKDIVLEDDDKAALDAGKDVSVWVTVTDNTATVSEEDKQLVENTVEELLGEDFTVGNYLDLKLWKQVEGTDVQQITEVPNGNVKVTIVVPEDMRKPGATYKIIRVHNGVVTVIDTTLDSATWRLSFETNSFSTYALVCGESTVEKSADWLEPYRLQLHIAA